MIADLGIAELEAKAERLLIGFVVSLVLGAALFAAGWWEGSSSAHKADAIAEQAKTFAAVAAQVKADNQTLAREHELRLRDRAGYERYIKEKDDAQDHDHRLIADLQRDVKRLRVPVIRPAGPAAPDACRPAAAGTGEDRYAELSPDAGSFVVGLLERGDEGIRKHAEVVARYNRLAAQCSQPPTTKEQ